MNSGIDGMSSSSILWFMTFVMSVDTPGSPPANVGKWRPGLPTVAILMWSWRALWMASSPKNVKKRFASIPSARAPFAMISAG